MELVRSPEPDLPALLEGMEVLGYRIETLNHLLEYYRKKYYDEGFLVVLGEMAERLQTDFNDLDVILEALAEKNLHRLLVSQGVDANADKNINES